MSVRSKSTKEEKQRAVSKAVLEVIEKDGLLGVTHSKVSRKSGVSRAWIYEYLGQDKNALIEFAADVFARHFSRVENVALPKTMEQLQEQLKDGVSFLFDAVSNDAVIIKLYFRFRGTQNPIGEVIKKYEKQWLSGASKSANEILGLPAHQASLLAELILTLRLGFAHRFATSGTPEDSRKRGTEVFNLIHDLISGTHSERS